ncbi:hypothetical protein GQ457_02G035450 [Hibiscus cannabinus]
MEVHRVVRPPHESTLGKLKTTFKETFFPDDPLRQFEGQPILAAQYIFPILQWGRNYNLKLLKSDIVSGLTIASLAVVDNISYARLVYLPPVIGLYSSLVPPLVYAALGGSKDLVVGPVSIASLVLRLGFIIDFLSQPTLIGFVAGAAIIVSLQQLKVLLGITHFTEKKGLVPLPQLCFLQPKGVVLANNTNGLLHPGVLASGKTCCTLLFTHVFVIILHCEYGFDLSLCAMQSIKRPNLFWVSAGAPLFSIIMSTLLVFAFKAQNNGINTIGKLREEWNPPSWCMLQFHGSHLGLFIKTGLVTGIISLTEGIAVGRTFASLKNYKVDGNKEMVAIGMMNMVGSYTSCYLTTGSFSPTAVNHMAGGKTAVSNIIMSVMVTLTLLLHMHLFQYTPNVVLGAIRVSAVIGLIDIPAAYRIWKMDKFDFLVMLCAFFGVVFISVQGGLAIAVGISILKILLRITRPKTVMLGNIPGTDIFRDLHHYKESMKIPGFLILRIEASINFANSTYLNERVLRWIEEEYEAESSLRFLILEMSAVSGIDTSGTSFFKELKKTVEKKGAKLVWVNPLGEVMEKLLKSDEVGEFIRPDCLFLTYVLRRISNGVRNLLTLLGIFKRKTILNMMNMYGHLDETRNKRDYVFANNHVQDWYDQIYSSLSCVKQRHIK